MEAVRVLRSPSPAQAKEPGPAAGLDSRAEGMPAGGWPGESCLEGGDVVRDGRRILDHHLAVRPRRQRGHGLEIAAARVARLDLTHVAGDLRDQRAQRSMLGIPAVGTREPIEAPVPAAPPASKLAAQLETARLGESRPCAAQRTVAVTPLRGRVPGDAG